MPKQMPAVAGSLAHILREVMGHYFVILIRAIRFPEAAIPHERFQEALTSALLSDPA